jgi:hypothetical protein
MLQVVTTQFKGKPDIIEMEVTNTFYLKTVYIGPGGQVPWFNKPWVQIP